MDCAGYSLVLNEEQIAEMGGDPASHGITEEFDVIRFRSHAQAETGLTCPRTGRADPAKI
jgi:hypothetical protein